ncbi:hypothetical protein FACS189426_08220 [Bacteroidia bacterium]|nr:hypothetical protein FACS189426_08220 [Bacteroidia bacterium]GHV71044.1 hypothetical protein FACS189420_4620 [Bacteroidia bacterium]
MGIFAQVFSKGDKVVNLGVGIIPYVNYSGYSNKVLPISGSFEYGLFDNLFDEHSAIGVGGYIAYTSWESKGQNDWTVSDFILGARGAFHYQFVDKLDTYAGVMFGYDVVSYSEAHQDIAGSGVASSFFTGARYYFTDNLAAFGELGYGVAALQLGVSFKF